MKQYIYFFISTSLLLAGCTGKPERKKLPDLSVLPGWENLPLVDAEKGFYFTGDTTLPDEGRLTYCGVAMPDPAYDSLTVAMVTGYAPIAGKLFEQWEAEGKKGLLIDLRSNPAEEYSRADFLVKPLEGDSKTVKIPVVFIWDHFSAARARYLINMMQSVPKINCMLVADSRHTGGLPRTDCFSPKTLGYEDK